MADGTFRREGVRTFRSTCNLQPATCNLQPATCNLQPATCNLQRATCNLQPPSSRHGFYRHGHRFTPAQTQRGNAPSAAATQQGVDERHQDARASGADRVTKRDCAAVSAG